MLGERGPSTNAHLSASLESPSVITRILPVRMSESCSADDSEQDLRCRLPVLVRSTDSLASLIHTVQEWYR